MLGNQSCQPPTVKERHCSSSRAARPSTTARAKLGQAWTKMRSFHAETVNKSLLHCIVVTHPSFGQDSVPLQTTKSACSFGGRRTCGGPVVHLPARPCDAPRHLHVPFHLDSLHGAHVHTQRDVACATGCSFRRSPDNARHDGQASALQVCVQVRRAELKRCPAQALTKPLQRAWQIYMDSPHTRTNLT